MADQSEDDLVLELAKAMWAEDARVNGHSNRWEDIDDGTQSLFKSYAQVALDRLNRIESASMT